MDVPEPSTVTFNGEGGMLKKALIQIVKHVDQLARRVGVDHRLAGARVSVPAKNHGGVATQHADEILKSGEALWGLSGRRSGRCFGRFGRGGWNLCCLALGFPLFLLDDFLAQFPLGSKRATVDNAKRFFLFVVGQGTSLSKLYRLQFITGCLPESLRPAH